MSEVEVKLIGDPSQEFERNIAELWGRDREDLAKERLENSNLRKERDTLIRVLKECVVALERSHVCREPECDIYKAVTHAKSTLSKYER